MSNRIRVLRVLEYTYPNMAAAIEDQSRWTRTMPTPAHMRNEDGMTMREVGVMFDEVVPTGQAFMPIRVCDKPGVLHPCHRAQDESGVHWCPGVEPGPND